MDWNFVDHGSRHWNGFLYFYEMEIIDQLMTLDWSDVPILIAILVPFGGTIAYIVRLEMRVKQLEQSKNNNPLEILKKRLAEGKITPEEFEKRRKKIE